MFYIPKTDNYLQILTDDEVKNFVAVNFGEYFKSMRKKLYSKLNEEQNLKTYGLDHAIEFFYNSICHYNFKILNLFYTKSKIEKKLKVLLSELKTYCQN